MEGLRKLGLTGYCEFSGYRGYHVWIFFSEWIPVRYVYSLEEVIAAKVKDFPSAITIEFFPWKSRRKTKGPRTGNQITIWHAFNWKEEKLFLR